MSELIQRYVTEVVDDGGTTYSIFAYGEGLPGGTWEGWLEFHPADASQPILRTGRETTQPDRRALEYWASGLEPLYFDGAFDRARGS